MGRSIDRGVDLGLDLTWNRGATGFAWGWLLLALAVLVVALLVRWAITRERSSEVPDAALVAHAARLRRLPRYRRLVRRRLLLGTATSVAALLAISGALVLAGRVQERQVTEQSDRTRDIVLCLDSSGSMAQVDASVLREFSSIVRGLRGERVGLTIWSGSAITVFPLTDDYRFVLEQLRAAEQAFGSGSVYSDAYGQFTAGTITDYDVQSQIGDGLASCVQRFDRREEDRSRAIVLASDNEPIGQGVFPLSDAAALAASKGIVVHGIAAPATAERPDAVGEFRSAAAATGGTFSLLGQDGSAAAVVEAIGALDATRTERPPVVRVLDQPGLGTLLAALGVGGLLLVWGIEAALGRISRRRSAA